VTSVGFVGFVSGDTNNPLDVIIYDQTNDINVANAAAGINNWPFGSGSAAFVNVDNWLTDFPVLEPGIQYYLEITPEFEASNGYFGIVYDDGAEIPYGKVGFDCIGCDEAVGSMIFQIMQEEPIPPEPTPSEPQATSSVEQTQQNLFNLVWTLFAVIFFTIWFLRGRN